MFQSLQIQLLVCVAFLQGEKCLLKYSLCMGGKNVLSSKIQCTSGYCIICLPLKIAFRSSNNSNDNNN